jgi:signal transduction histidine kinase
MKGMLSLRSVVILGIISLTAMLSGTIFYLTAFRFHRVTENVMAQQISKRCETAARLWESGVGAVDLAQFALEDASIIQMVFIGKGGGRRAFSRQKGELLTTTLQTFEHPLDKYPGAVRELKTPSGFLHTEGHILEVAATGDSGQVELVFSTAMVNAQVARLIVWGLEIIAVVVLAAGAGVYYIDRRLGRIVKRMIETASKIGSGELNQQLVIHTGDPLEELGAAFNRLAAALSHRQTEIDRAHAELAATIATQTAELRQERDRMSMILENLPSAFLLFNQDLTVIAATSAVERLAGVVLPTDHRQACTCTLRSSGDPGCIIQAAKIRGGAVTGWQVKANVNGEVRSLQYCAYPVREDRKIIGWLETITDVSEQVRQQSRVIRAERLSVAGELAATLAHEMRNRLTSVKMLLQIEIEASNLTSAQHEHQKHIAESVRDMERMIEELLAFARPAPLSKSKVNLRGLMDAVAEAVEPMAQASRVRVEYVNHADRNTAMLDLNKMRQVLGNLLLNAMQHAGQPGKVILSIEQLDDPGLARRLTMRRNSTIGGQRASASASGELLCFTVDDSGPGVPVNLRAKIFEPFFSTRSSGTGLGLAMVRRAVRDQGGTVVVEESPLGGARFRVVVPVEDLL